MRGVCKIATSMVLGSVMLLSLETSTKAEQLRFRIGFATYLGGDHFDQAREVIVDHDGSIVVGAQSASADMPTSTVDAFSGWFPRTAEQMRPVYFLALGNHIVKNKGVNVTE